MLYNPKWEEKHDPLTMLALVAWLEKRDPTEHYCYSDPRSCLAAQYNKSIGRKYTVVWVMTWLWSGFDWKMERLAAKGPHTFGAALKRARAYL